MFFALQIALETLGQVQYWSDSKNRWMDAIVEGIRLKDPLAFHELLSQ